MAETFGKNIGMDTGCIILGDVAPFGFGGEHCFQGSKGVVNVQGLASTCNGDPAAYCFSFIYVHVMGIQLHIVFH